MINVNRLGSVVPALRTFFGASTPNPAAETAMSPEEIVRAWEDKDYRASLSEEQLKQIPEHPAGLPRLRMARASAGFQISTNNCSTDNCSGNNCSTNNCSGNNCSTDNCSGNNCSTNNCSTNNCSGSACTASNCSYNGCTIKPCGGY